MSAKHSRDVLTEKTLTWHRMLLGGNKRVAVGQWRSHEEPMQVISGELEKRKCIMKRRHHQSSKEMKRFIQWFNDTAPGGKQEIKKPCAFCYRSFVFWNHTSFEDGNGRIGRAIAEKHCRKRSEGLFLLSLSRTIEASRKLYYDSLESQQSNEITPWIAYFIKTSLECTGWSGRTNWIYPEENKILWRFKDKLNHRQLTVIRRMLEEGTKGFWRRYECKKYIGITKTSKPRLQGTCSS